MTQKPPPTAISLVPTYKLKGHRGQMERERRLRRSAGLWRKGWSVGYPAPGVGMRKARRPKKVRLKNSIGLRPRIRWIHKANAV